MRIIGGRWRGRAIRVPTGDTIRPTADRAREAWMSVVRTSLPEARVLDLFAGSGALGLEALSRGAASCDFVDLAPLGIRTIRENAASLGATGQITTHRADAFDFVHTLSPLAYDLAFADPPYGLGHAARLAEQWLSVPFARLLGVEHEAGAAVPGGGVTRRYGIAAITMYGGTRCEM